jgi:hypothetical protein
VERVRHVPAPAVAGVGTPDTGLCPEETAAVIGQIPRARYRTMGTPD